MVDLLRAFHFRRHVRIFRFDGEREDESTASIETLKERDVVQERNVSLTYVIGCDGQSEMKKIIRIGIRHLTGRR